MRINFKDWLTWVRVCAIILIGCMWIWSLPTLKSWAWGFWSIEYLVTFATIILYLWWDGETTKSRRLCRIENKLDALRGNSE